MLTLGEIFSKTHLLKCVASLNILHEGNYDIKAEMCKFN